MKKVTAYFFDGSYPICYERETTLTDHDEIVEFICKYAKMGKDCLFDCFLVENGGEPINIYSDKGLYRLMINHNT